MLYMTRYLSPLGDIVLTGDNVGLTGLWFKGEKLDALLADGRYTEMETSLFHTVKKWLDIYFTGREPDFMPPFHTTGSDFQLTVWELLRQIPYGETTTYGELAKRIAERRGLPRMSAQAVGGAVGRNPISIIVPCHRVVGTNGSLTGYAGGIERKKALLILEGVRTTGLFVPTKGTALRLKE